MAILRRWKDITVFGLLAGSVILGLFVVASNMKNGKRIDPEQSGKMHIVTTFAPMYVFTKNVAGDAAFVENLLPPGTEVHEYSFTPSDIAKLGEADIVVKNGRHFDDWVDAAVRATGKNTVLLDASAELDVMQPGVRKGASGVFPGKMASDPKENPHTWANPAFAYRMVEHIRDVLQKTDPRNAAQYEENTKRYLARLFALDAELRSTLEGHGTLAYIAEETSVGFFAREYGLTEVTTIGMEPGAALAARDREALEQAIRSKKVQVIIKNAGSESQVIDSLARDLGLSVIAFNPYESGPLEVQGYEEVMRENERALTAAFGIQK